MMHSIKTVNTPVRIYNNYPFTCKILSTNLHSILLLSYAIAKYVLDSYNKVHTENIDNVLFFVRK